MSDELRTRVEVTIDAPAEQVWKALTTPERDQAVVLRCGDGDRLDRGGSDRAPRQYQGEPYEDKGTIVKVDPGRLLVHTHWSPVSGLPDSPENYQQVSWALSERDDTTELVVTEVNLPSEAAKEVSEQGWRAALAALKDLLETG